MTVIDISRTLESSLAVWPGDTPFERRTMLAMADGAFVNLSTLTLSSHTGAHVDAPFHVQRNGVTIERLALDAYWGPAQVVTVHKPAGPLAPAEKNTPARTRCLTSLGRASTHLPTSARLVGSGV